MRVPHPWSPYIMCYLRERMSAGVLTLRILGWRLSSVISISHKCSDNSIIRDRWKQKMSPCRTEGHDHWHREYRGMAASRECWQSTRSQETKLQRLCQSHGSVAFLSWFLPVIIISDLGRATSMKKINFCSLNLSSLCFFLPLATGKWYSCQ